MALFGLFDWLFDPLRDFLSSTLGIVSAAMVFVVVCGGAYVAVRTYLAIQLLLLRHRVEVAAARINAAATHVPSPPKK